MLADVFTSLFDQLQAAIRGARDKTVAQVPTRQLPCINAGQSVHGAEYSECCKVKMSNN